MNFITEEDQQKLQQIYYLEQFEEDVQNCGNDFVKLNNEVEDFLIESSICLNSKQSLEYCSQIISQKIEHEKKLLSNNSDESEDEETMDGQCEMCLTYEKITKHHAIPKLVLKRLRKANKSAPIIFIALCKWCHKKIHQTFTHKELAKNYFKIDQLLEATELQSYIENSRKFTQR